MRPQEGALQITSVVLAGLVFVLMGVVLLRVLFRELFSPLQQACIPLCCFPLRMNSSLSGTILLV